MSYPPTPEKHGRNVARLQLLEAMLAKLLLLIDQATPDLAPFDMNQEQARLCCASEEGKSLLRMLRRSQDARDLDESEPDPDEPDGGTA